MQLRLFVLLYADDTVLLSDSPAELQQVLSCLHDNCEKWQLQVNTDKTKIVIFSRGLVRSNPDFKFGDSVVKVQQDYDYLGTTLNYNGTFTKQVNKQVCLAKRAMFGLLGKIRNLHLPMDIVRHLFETCIIPILLYGCVVWGFPNLSEIESVQTCFYKYLLKLNKGTASCIILGELGCSKL